MMAFSFAGVLGSSRDVHVPMNAVQDHCQENGEGMWFPRKEHPENPDDEPPRGERGNRKGNDGPKLKVVK